MKVLVVIFFALTMPVVLFFATILYGGVSRTQIKTALAESNIYQELHKYMSTERTYTGNYYDQFTPIVGARLTPEYLKSKTDLVIDETADWIKGKSQKPPTVSLKELKDDLAVRHPDLISRLENVPDEKELAEAGVPAEERKTYLTQAKQLSEFTKNDFTLSFESYLEGFKLVYQSLFLTILILALILLLSLVTLVTHVDTPPKKFKWLGATFLSSAIVGFLIVYFNNVITGFIAKISLPDQTEFIALITPLFLTAINHFIKVYSGFQAVANIVFLVLAIGCFIGVFMTRKQADPKLKPLNVKRSFWKQPAKK